MKLVKFSIKKMEQVCEIILFLIYFSLAHLSMISSGICVILYSRAIPNDCNLFILIMNVTNFFAILGSYTVNYIFSKKINQSEELKSSVWLKAVFCFISIVWFAVLVLTIVEMKLIIKDINLIDGFLFYSAVINMILTFLSMILMIFTFIHLIEYMRIN